MLSPLRVTATYHGVHAWAGQGVLRDHVANWVRVLGDLKAKYADPEVVVLPAHGAPSDPTLFDRMRVYLDDFMSAVDGERTDSVAFHGPEARSKRAA
jgi:hypothetical protein